jgi:catechol 2,3-dioxygenase-like lactoylglutathione lyase family enzyme
MTRVHLSLRTPDLGAARVFYTRLLGTEPDKVHDDHVRFTPDDVPVVLTLMPGPASVDHMGLRHDDPAAARAHAERLGLALSDDVVCCHAEKAEVWQRDPDGRPWEIYAVTDDAPAAPAVTGSACCR